MFLCNHGPLSYRREETLRRYLRCGRLMYGFAKARCSSCGHEFLVAFSCQLRGICPSCQQKRAELLCDFLEEEVIEKVSHRQIVFVLPKVLRSMIFRDLTLLSCISKAAFETTREFYRLALRRDDLSIGMITLPQLFGDKLNPHPHLHSIVTEGAFDKEGRFLRLNTKGSYSNNALKNLFETKVLDFLVNKRRLSEHFKEEVLSWEHSGFSVDLSLRIDKDDKQGLKRLIRYMARPPVSNERVIYDKNTGTVKILSTKKIRGVRKIVVRYDAMTFLSLLCLQVPPKNIHLIRYYGYYS